MARFLPVWVASGLWGWLSWGFGVAGCLRLVVTDVLLEFEDGVVACLLCLICGF